MKTPAQKHRELLFGYMTSLQAEAVKKAEDEGWHLNFISTRNQDAVMTSKTHVGAKRINRHGGHVT